MTRVCDLQLRLQLDKELKWSAGQQRPRAHEAPGQALPSQEAGVIQFLPKKTVLLSLSSGKCTVLQGGMFEWVGEARKGTHRGWTNG